MRLLNVEQNTPEWKELRRSKLGASDIAILMAGTDKEIYALYMEKIEGKERFQTESMRRGSDMEAEARRWMEEQLGMKFERPVGQHDEHEWLIASFDGLNFEHGVSLEIKCPNVVPEKVEDLFAWKKYYWQVQAQLAVGGHAKAIVLAYGQDKQVQAVIERDDKDIAKLIKQGQWFMGHLENKIPPLYIENKETEKALELYERAKTIKPRLDEYEAQWKALKEESIQEADGCSFMCNGLKVQKIETKGSIDYKAAVESLLPNADLSKFQKKPTEQWRISIS